MRSAPFRIERLATQAAGLLRERTDPVFAVAMLVTSVVYLRPLVTAPIVPAADSPAHLALVTVLRHVGDPHHVLGQVFHRGVFPAPNSLYYLSGLALSLLLSPLAAERALVLAYALGTPAAVAYFASAFSRSKWVALLVFPLLLQWPFTEGFLDYCLGVPLSLLCLGSLQYTLRAPSPRRILLQAALVAALFFTHLETFALYGAASVLLVLMAAVDRARTPAVAPWRAWTLRAASAAWGSGLALLGLWALRAYSGLRAETAAAPPINPPIEEKLKVFLDQSVLTLDGSGGAVIAAAVVVCALVFAVALRSIPSTSTGQATPESALVTDFPLALLALLVVLYVVLPVNVGRYYHVGGRLAMVMWLVAPVCLLPAGKDLSRSVRGRQQTAGHAPALRWLAVLPLLAAVAVGAWEWRPAFASLRQAMDGFWPVLSAARRQSRLAWYPERNEPTGFRSNLWRHLGQYHTALNEGPTSFSFGVHPGRVVAQVDPSFEFERATPSDIARIARTGCYDEILQHGPTDLSARYPGAFALVKREKSWALYEVKTPCAGR